MTKHRSARILAQAKINIALRLLGRDPSGYHPLETLFLRIDLGDEIVVKTSTSRVRTVTSSVDVGPTNENLAFRAATAYCTATGWPSGWEIRIDKKIPVGAGLGGGSADAGAVLRALNTLCPSPVSQSQLQGIGANLGADVSFLTSNCVLALAEGFGERLTALPAPPSRLLAIAIPNFAVATPDAYSWVDEDEATRAGRNRWDLQDLSWTALDGLVSNDFSPVVGRRHPQIPQILEALISHGAAAAEMSGSGSAVFAFFDEKPAGGRIKLPPGVKLLWTCTSDRVVEPQIVD